MKDNELENVFKDLDFDVFETPEHHENEFLKKLEKANKEDGSKNERRVVQLWKPLLLVAACLAIGVFVFGEQLVPQTTKGTDLASVSQEMATTQNFYSTLIKTEISKLEEQQTPETKKLIDDTMAQLQQLELDYQQLKKDLKSSGNDQRVIYAMVSNFQQRIALLETVLLTIEDIKELKSQDNESNIL